jgi:uncharacterized Zn finger protein
MATKSPRAAKAKASAKSESLQSKWESVTWDVVANWAGSRSMTRGRAYQRGGCIRDLAISAEGKLLATVAGGRRYATGVWWEADRLRSSCTCPVGWNGCKHAVAVVAAYLDVLAKGVDVPIADAEDGRWEELASNVPEALYDDFEENDESEDDEARPVARRRTGKGRVDDEKSFPDLREEFRERIATGEGDADCLIAEARKELRRATSEPGWRNYWKGEGYTPDFSRLAGYLDRMVEFGHADDAVNLSREIMSRGMEMIGQSNDKGETATAFAECLPPIFRAVTKSNLPPVEKLLFAIDADLKDEFGMIESNYVNTVLEGDASPSDWSAVSDELASHLKSGVRIGSNFHDKYQRERIADWLVRALTRAGRDDEVIAVRERPGREKFAEMVVTAERAGCRDAVERLALEFLATGKPAFSAAVTKDGAHSGAIHRDWPLPLPDYLLPLLRIGDAHPHLRRADRHGHCRSPPG